jgi:hypothetical protein
MLVSTNPLNDSLLYLIDYGITEKYLDEEGNHIEMKL